MRNGADVHTPGSRYSARLMFQHPAKTLKYIEQCGCRKLGDFEVQVSVKNPHRLIAGSAFSLPGHQLALSDDCDAALILHAGRCLLQYSWLRLG